MNRKNSIPNPIARERKTATFEESGDRVNPHSLTNTLALTRARSLGLQVEGHQGGRFCPAPGGREERGGRPEEKEEGKGRKKRARGR